MFKVVVVTYNLVTNKSWLYNNNYRMPIKLEHNLNKVKLEYNNYNKKFQIYKDKVIKLNNWMSNWVLLNQMLKIVKVIYKNQEIKYKIWINKYNNYNLQEYKSQL